MCPVPQDLPFQKQDWEKDLLNHDSNNEKPNSSFLSAAASLKLSTNSQALADFHD